MIGGQIPSYAGPLQFEFDKTSPQDPWSQGIAVFDMTALKFQDTYRSKADPYEPPYVVQQYYNKRWVYDNHLRNDSIEFDWQLINF